MVSKGSSRIFGLDVLRGVAVLLVFTLHYFSLSQTRGFCYTNYIKYFGLGVDMFFALSGFLLLPKIFQISPIRFLKKRVNRIVPAFLIVHGLCLVFSGLFRMNTTIVDLSSFLFIQQVLSTEFNHINPVTWSLEIEWQFYLLIALGSKLKNRFRSSAMLVIIYFGSIYFLSLEMDHGRNIFFYAHYFILGGLCSEMVNNLKKASINSLLYTLSLPITVLCITLFKGLESFHILKLVAVDVLLMIILVLSSMSIKETKILSALRWLGEVSYSFYLLHYPIIYALIVKWKLVSLEGYLLVMLITLISSHILYSKIERRHDLIFKTF